MNPAALSVHVCVALGRYHKPIYQNVGRHRGRIWGRSWGHENYQKNWRST